MILAADTLHLQRRGRTVLAGLSAAFAPGTVTAILGPNGAGKSTLMDALSGLLAPSAGALTLDGTPLGAVPPKARARAIGYLPQGGAVHWNLLSRELVALGRLPHRGAFSRASGSDTAAVGRALDAADLAGLADRPVHSLSGGERARVLLARVLAAEPKILLADEPLANLDPRHAVDALGLFRRAAASGVAVVLVLHDLQAAARAADRLILLAEGRCLADGTPAEVLTPGRLHAAYGVEMLVREDREAGLLVVPMG